MNPVCLDQQQSSRFNVEFKVLLKNTEDLVGPSCDARCKQGNMRAILQELFALKTVVEKEVKAEDSSLEVSSLDIDTKSFSQGDLVLMCQEPGRVLTKTRLCVPCAAGYYLPDPAHLHCTACPIGTYQHKEGATTCNLCPEDSTTKAPGSTHVTQCSERISPIPEAPWSSEDTVPAKYTGGATYMSLDGQPQTVDEFIDDALAFLDE